MSTTDPMPQNPLQDPDIETVDPLDPMVNPMEPGTEPMTNPMPDEDGDESDDETVAP